MNDELNLKEIEPNQLEQSFIIIKACAAELESQGFTHWSEYYTSIEMYKQYLQEHNSEVFMIQKDGKFVATVAISPNPPDYFLNPEFGPYKEQGFMQFFTPVESAVYISALGVHPDFANQGLGRELLKQVEELSKKRGVKSIRFDTRTEYTHAVKFYEGMGYHKVFTDVVSPEENYNYYEKLL